VARSVDLDRPRGIRGLDRALSDNPLLAARLRIAFVLVLLAATAGAFVVAEHLKLEPAALKGVRVTKLFSPVCRCSTELGTVQFHLRKPDDVKVEILDSSSRVVRVLATGAHVGSTPVDFRWDGRNARGAVVPDGEYRPRVILAGTARRFELASTIEVDSTPPRVVVASARPKTISIASKGPHAITIRYRVSEPTVTMLYVDGVRSVRVRGTKPVHELRWRGRVRGQPRRGQRRLEVVSRDLAGNVAHAPPILVTVR
jgi:hypothetical protein